MSAETLLVDSIPPVCTITDVCRVLRVSRAKFYALKRAGRWPVPEIDPPLDNRPRFSGEKVRAYIVGEKTRRPA